MSQTLINGTAYEIDHGLTLIDSTQYTIDHGLTLVDGTARTIEFVSGVPYSLDDWVGWENASWEDINNLCYAKQRGYIDDWPDDVVVGAEKDFTQGTSALTNQVTVVIVGRDEDGEGTLTFGALKGFEQTTRWADNSSDVWTSSLARTRCQHVYNDCDIKDYILPVLKGTCLTRVDTGDGEATYTTETIWLPSYKEMGFSNTTETCYTSIRDQNATTTNSECTYDYNSAYSYYTEASKRIKYYYTQAKPYWLRSITAWRDSCALSVASDGTRDFFSQTCADKYYLAPHFVVGNPEAQTIE